MIDNNSIMPKILCDVTPTTVHERLLDMWLHERSPNTVDYYRRIAQHFLKYIGKPLHLATLADVQGWQLTLRGLAPSSQCTYAAAIKSLFTFGHKIGVLSVNVGQAMRQPKSRDTLNERILSELEVQTMIEEETHQRNRLIIRLLYSGGLRVSELCALKWKDLNIRGDTGQLTVLGKGNKTRTVLLSHNVWNELMALKGDATPLDAVFPSRNSKGGERHLDRTMVLRIVSAAGKRAGIEKVSPHWLRHAHASHSLDRGAPIHLVQQTLGHASVATTSRYLHARPNDSSALYLPD
ncbi:MAG: tyrosine-type recombinase/integrase [Crinalium sp.]